MERKTTTVCSYRKCKNSYKKRKELRMFRFPKHLSHEWVQNCGNPDLIGLSPRRLYKNKRVCEEHFRKEDILPSGRLSTGTIPLPYQCTEQSPMTSCAANREIVNTNCTDVEITNQSVQVGRIQHTYERSMPGIQPIVSPDCKTFASPAVSTSSATFTVEQSPSTRRWIENVSPARNADRTAFIRAKRSLFASANVKSIETKLKQCKLKLAAKRTALNRMKKQILKIKSEKQPLNQFKSKDAVVLCNMQFHKVRQSWTKEERKFSTALYLKSPSTYKYLHRRIVLPGQSTVQRWLRSKELFRPGFNKSILEQIKLKASTMNAMERSVVLMFDEMALKKSLEYSQKHDIIEGFKDTGHFGRGPEIAKQAAVFMVRGLYYQWKLPVAYFVTENGLTGTETKELIIESVKKLEEAGLKVKAVVCDQCSTNVSAYAKLNVTEDSPYFVKSNKEKGFALYDTPHLLKSLRNNLITHDFQLNGKIISFADVRELYKIETSSGTTRAAHKLSAAHIWPNSFQKLSVSLAGQVFSHTTSAALKTAVATGDITSPSAINTAEFLQKINLLYDSMNSKKQKTQNPASCALSKTNIQIKAILEEGLNTFKVLRKVNAKYPEPPCFRGFRLTINAILQLFVSEKCDYLLTSRLNQDPLENLFSSIRQRGGFNRNPTVRVFRGSLRVCTLKQMVEPPRSTSYDPDLDDLLDMNTIPQSLLAANEDDIDIAKGVPYEPIDNSEESSSEGEPAPVETEGPVFQRENTVTLEECSQIYFAGYIAHSYYKKFKCQECLNKMCNLTSKLDSKKELLLLNRSFSNVKIDVTSGLLSPSENLEHVVNTALKLFRNKFCKISHKLHLVKRFVKLTKSIVSLDSLICVGCQDRADFVIETLFRVLVHKQCKWVSNDLKNSALAKLKILKNI